MKQSNETKTTSKKSKPKYKAIFIDWNGTLSPSKFWGHLEHLNHPDNALFTKIESSLFGNLSPLLKPWMKGELTSEIVIQKIAEDSKLPYDRVLEEFIISCQKMQFVSDNVLNLIKVIRDKNVKVVIATDNMDSFSRWTVPALLLNTHFDDILDSHTLKAMKGDMDDSGKSLFFDDFITRNGILPGESVLIDDSEDKEGRIGNIGIEYRKIEPVVGLVPELEQIITLLR